MTIERRLEELRQMREEAFRAGGPERVAKVHQAGKLLARERVEVEYASVRNGGQKRYTLVDDLLSPYVRGGRGQSAIVRA